MSTSERKRGEISREVILEAAEIVFAEQGFDGARVDTIAHLSGYDKKLLFHYYGDKLGLYTEVLKRADQQAHVQGIAPGRKRLGIHIPGRTD